MNSTRFFVRFLLPACIGLSMAACQSGDTGVGQGIISPTELSIQLVDTVSVQTATVLADTFITSVDNNILVGQWNDPQTGRTFAEGYAAVNFAPQNLATRIQPRFDSLAFELPYGFRYGDTTRAVTVQVSQLTNRLLPTRIYYNDNKATYQPAPLTRKTFVPSVSENNRLLRIRLADALGKQFFDKLVDATIDSDETMTNFWTGFAFSPVTTAGSTQPNTLLGLNMAANQGALVLYFHDNDATQTRQTVRFGLSFVHYSYVVNQVAGAGLAGLANRQNSVISDQTNRTTFVSPIARLRTRLIIPGLSTLPLPVGFAGVNRAELIIQPVRLNVRDNVNPPSALVLWQTNAANELLQPVPGGTTGSNQATAFYQIDGSNPLLPDQYLFNLTEYVSSILRKQTPNRALILTTSSNAQQIPALSPQRVVLGDGRNANDRIRLRLYLTIGKK